MRAMSLLWAMALATSARATAGVLQTSDLRQLVIFRGRTRQTEGFEPADFDLPVLELQALEEDLRLSAAPARADYGQVSTGVLGGTLACWADGPDAERLLAAAARRAILVRSAFAIVGTAGASGVAGVIDASTQLIDAGYAAPDAREVELIDLEEPNLRGDARAQMRAQLAEVSPPLMTESSRSELGAETVRRPLSELSLSAQL